MQDRLRHRDLDLHEFEVLVAAGRERHGAVGPREDRPQDVLDLIAYQHEELFVRQQAHLHERDAVALLRLFEEAHAFVVLLLREAPFAHEAVAERFGDLIRRGEDDVAAVEEDPFQLGAAAAVDDARRFVVMDLDQNLRQRRLPEVGLVEGGAG